MRYRVQHKTTYSYISPVAISHNVLHISPRATERQIIHRHQVLFSPNAAQRDHAIDWYGNAVIHGTVQEPHSVLIISADTELTIQAPIIVNAMGTMPWEQASNALLQEHPDKQWREAVEFRFTSPYCPIDLAFATEARQCFTPGRPLLQAALDLTVFIFKNYTYDSLATTNDTPVQDVLKSRRGVCQDFAHVMISMLRSLGLAARYVSGYLETVPPAGQKRMIGADASHAWIQIYVPAVGWVDLDPTNGIATADRHVTVGWGRDVTDVTPTKGMILGGGQQTIAVSVDVEPLPDQPTRPTQIQNQTQLQTQTQNQMQNLPPTPRPS